MPGPGSAPWNQRRSSHPGGLIKSVVPGRTDRLPMNVPSGAYILPSDVVSSIGQGNTMAGGEILGRMLGLGPYGSKAAPMRGGRPNMPRLRPVSRRMPSAPTMQFQDGGDVEQDSAEPVDIFTAGGEFLIDPETVAELGNGDLAAGHRVLHAFCLRVRREHIRTLRNLKEPKT